MLENYRAWYNYLHFYVCRFIPRFRNTISYQIAFKSISLLIRSIVLYEILRNMKTFFNGFRLILWKYFFNKFRNTASFTPIGMIDIKDATLLPGEGTELLYTNRLGNGWAYQKFAKQQPTNQSSKTASLLLTSNHTVFSGEHSFLCFDFCFR